MKYLLLFAIMSFSLSCPAHEHGHAQNRTAVCSVRTNQDKVLGRIYFKEGSSGLTIEGKLKDLFPSLPGTLRIYQSTRPLTNIGPEGILPPSDEWFKFIADTTGSGELNVRSTFGSFSGDSSIIGGVCHLRVSSPNNTTLYGCGRIKYIDDNQADSTATRRNALRTLPRCLAAASLLDESVSRTTEVA
jgi:hypothetical protein